MNTVLVRTGCVYPTLSSAGTGNREDRNPFGQSKHQKSLRLPHSSGMGSPVTVDPDYILYHIKHARGNLTETRSLNVR